VGEELTEDEREVFHALTGREREPLEPCEEFWGAIGRSGGKTRAMAVLAAYIAGCVDHRDTLAPGERGRLPTLAASTAQASQAFNFVSGVFSTSPNLKELLDRETADTISLASGVDVVIRPASFRTIRGITAVAVIADEIAFWRSDDSANPDTEILRALRPALATTGGLLAAISSPHAKRGELYTTFKRHFRPTGDPLIPVAKAPSPTMNPALSPRVVDRAFESDPEAASAEYGAEFRGDIGVFIARDVLESCVARGVVVRPPLAGMSYFAFTDPSGGSSDSMTLAIAHLENDRTVLDCIAERKAPFSPDSVVIEFAETLKAYRVSTVTGDRYACEWPRERFSAHGITYQPAEKNKSEIYLAFLPMLNSGRVDLLDNAGSIVQFLGLERRTSRAGRDTIDHAPNAHDDVANAIAGVMTSATDDTPGIIAFYIRRMRSSSASPMRPRSTRQHSFRCAARTARARRMAATAFATVSTSAVLFGSSLPTSILYAAPASRASSPKESQHDCTESRPSDATVRPSGGPPSEARRCRRRAGGDEPKACEARGSPEGRRGRVRRDSAA